MDFTKTKSFSFISTPLNIKIKGPFEIVPGHYLCKANKEQIEKIKQFLDIFPRQGFQAYPYEADLIVKKTGPGSKSYNEKKLLKKDWRYYVIKFKGTNSNLHNLLLVANIGIVEFQSDLTFIGKSSTSYNLNLLFKYYSELGWLAAKEIPQMNNRNFKEIGDLYKKYIGLKEEYSDIKRIIELFYSLNDLPKHSNFISLGMFSVIESLITHIPQSGETADSLTHQISTKIPLLTKRFQNKINYTKYFGKTEEDRIWKKLYDYRSKIAHGSKIEFSGKLKILKNAKNTMAFLRVITKALLRHALSEPQLYMDLRRC